MGRTQVINNKGMLELERRRYSKALEFFDKAIAMESQYSYAWGNRAIALHYLNRTEEALASVNRAIFLEPTNWKFWNTKGGIYVKLGNLNEAEKSFQTALNANPNYDEAWRNLGEVYRLMKQLDLADGFYDHALSLNPKMESAWLGKGQVAGALGKQEKSIELLDKALAIDNLDPVAWNEKGFALALKGDLLGAEKCFNASLVADPGFADAIGNKGEISRRLGKIEDAEIYINKAIEIQPSNPNNWNNKGALLSSLGKPDDALVCFNKAIELAPKHSDAVANKIGILGTMGRFDEAQELMESLSEQEDWETFQLPTHYLPKESPEVPIPNPTRTMPSGFLAELTKGTLVALRSFQVTKPVYVKSFMKNGVQGGLLETDFRDDFKKLMEMKFENSVAECRYGDGLADVRIQRTGSQLESMIFEFKIWGRNDYKDVVDQAMKYMTSFENCAAVVMINPNRKSLSEDYVERVILSQESFIDGSLVRSPLLHDTNLDHYSSDHRTRTSKVVKILHFVLDALS